MLQGETVSNFKFHQWPSIIKFFDNVVDQISQSNELTAITKITIGTIKHD